MNRISQTGFFLLSLVAAGVLSAGAQSPIVPGNAAWARDYAIDCGSATKHPCAASTNGYQNEFNGDPRLPPLLQRALPQRESWWVDGYAGSAPVSSIVQSFMGVPGELTVEGNRYVTATGCVPHACMVHGMLWIDTGTDPATVIFAGENTVAGRHNGEGGYHLYLYTSRELATYYAGNRPIGIFAPEFLKSLSHWHDANVSTYDDQKIVLTTVIWPNGRTHDLFWSDLLQPPPPANNSGAKQ